MLPWRVAHLALCSIRLHRLPVLRRSPFALRSLALILLAGVLALPVLAVLASWLPWGQGDAQAGSILREMAATVLPGYVGTTLWLSVMVALGAALVGTAAAAAVTLFDFPGRRTFEWLLLLPLAMPAYVTAYAYTDFLQFSGPLQVGLRNMFGLEGRLLPEVRSLGGAVWVFIFSLYPYVYLLARTALGERAAQLMEAARLLGAPLPRRIRAVALPLARPAVVKAPRVRPRAVATRAPRSAIRFVRASKVASCRCTCACRSFVASRTRSRSSSRSSTSLVSWSSSPRAARLLWPT